MYNHMLLFFHFVDLIPDVDSYNVTLVCYFAVKALH